MWTRIKVTAKDIRVGQPKKAQSCPIYLAAKRVMRNTASVGCLNIYTKDGNVHRLPKKVMRFIIDFDNDRPVKPFEFSVR